jgi:HEAT repeat protein
VGLHAADHLAEPDRAALRQALQDESAVVRIESAAALVHHGEAERALPLLAAALKHDSREVVLHAARALELLGPAARPVHREMQAALARAREGESAGDDIAMFIRFSLEGALDGPSR